MKLRTIAVVAVVSALQVAAGEKTLRGALDHQDQHDNEQRNLGGSKSHDDYKYAFLVSNVGYAKDWCLTADHGVHEGVRLGFKPCNFHRASARQLWRLDEDGRIHSKVNPDRCIIVNHGTHVVKGTRLRMANCDRGYTLGKFSHNGGTDFLRVKAEREYCVTNSGSHPNPTDFMVTELCKNQGDFKFTYKIYDHHSSTSGSGYHYPKYSSSDDKHYSSSSYSKSHHYSSSDSKSHHPKYTVLKSKSHAEFHPRFKNGCIVVKDKRARNDQHLILGSCHSAHGWWQDKDGLFHSELNRHKCMQADRAGPPKVGAMMRVFDCNPSNKLQRFDYRNGVIRLRGENLCAAFTGVIGNINHDPIILKPCKDDTALWGDYTY